ncbi:MAG: hypothetical protein H6506_00880 [Calditrichaeota bacterium]|nr:hypothetical protein [Calditrichota bacterium]MCB9366552.1 hypothetical protein [Calditrichota bacterium]MCB9391190.1 hypothetical protein [Calditrichota bacterium]
MTRRLWLCAALIATIGVSSCKKSPTGGTDTLPPEASGSYVGWGRPGNVGQNVRLALSEGDSGVWQGAITYGDNTTLISVSTVSETRDSVEFEYTRFVQYDLLGVFSEASVVLTVLQPSGQPSYTLNKEINGRNLSGEWRGTMFSEYLQDDAAATLYVDQLGALFDGDIRAPYSFYTLSGDINSGSMQNLSFYLGGVTGSDFPGYSFRLDGSFGTPDSISGSWQVYGNSVYDYGAFVFTREF